MFLKYVGWFNPAVFTIQCVLADVIPSLAIRKSKDNEVLYKIKTLCSSHFYTAYVFFTPFLLKDIIILSYFKFMTVSNLLFSLPSLHIYFKHTTHCNPFRGFFPSGSVFTEHLYCLWFHEANLKLLCHLLPMLLSLVYGSTAWWLTAGSSPRQLLGDMSRYYGQHERPETRKSCLAQFLCI